MKVGDRVHVAERLGYRARLAFIAFCVERCLGEARLHERAKADLARTPVLQEALDRIWSGAEGGAVDRERVTALAQELVSFEVGAPSRDGTIYRRDVVLVKAVIPALKGLSLLLDSSGADEIDAFSLDGGPPHRVSTARYVAGAAEGPYQAVAHVYADFRAATKSEMSVVDAALKRLDECSHEPVSRSVLVDIEDWRRLPVSRKYAGAGFSGSGDADP